MSDAVWLTAAALGGAAVGVWWYAAREERVRGRALAAVLRALAVALLIGGLRLPPLAVRGEADRGPVVLLDVSRSMALPAVPGGPSRLDSARSRLSALRPRSVILFGDEPVAVTPDSAFLARPSGRASRLVPALSVASGQGAADVIVLTDGEWDDYWEARAEAERLGLHVVEIRVAAPVARVGVATVTAPSRARAGDTAEVFAELVAAGEPSALPDTVELGLSTAGREVTRARTPVPAPGRTARVALRFLPAQPAATDEWRAYEVSLMPEADPYGAADRRRVWMEVSRGTRGAIVISLDPDWESRFLLPVLEGAAVGGARAYLQMSPDRFVLAGPEPQAVLSATRVQREARLADLLVVQGAPASLPDWLATLLATHDRVLHLPRGGGAVPGTPIHVVEAMGGDWYPSGELPASPISAFFAGIAAEELPPVGGLFSVTGPSEWTPLLARRDRLGPARPVLVAGGAEGRRWAVAAASGLWRWAFRDGMSRQAYRALFGGVAGWLLEFRAGRPVELERDPPPAGEPLGWRVRPRVRDLALAVYDSADGPVWADTISAPEGRVAGPALPDGPARFVATGRGPQGEFRVERPFDVGDAGGELRPRETFEPLRVGSGGAADRGERSARPRPVWPFALATLLLCGEWAWRRRIGLR
ncbi:MAG: hypothetical protein ACE5JR_00290 [Gemmatimonadota bacterium]